MDAIIRKCCIDLYRASQDINGNPGDFEKIYNEANDTIPYEDYFISGYKLHNIIKEYMDRCDTPHAFADIIYMKYAPNSSAASWRAKMKEREDIL